MHLEEQHPSLVIRAFTHVHRLFYKASGRPLTTRPVYLSCEGVDKSVLVAYYGSTQYNAWPHVTGLFSYLSYLYLRNTNNLTSIVRYLTAPCQAYVLLWGCEIAVGTAVEGSMETFIQFLMKYRNPSLEQQRQYYRRLREAKRKQGN